jgi:hypothetical protein
VLSTTFCSSGVGLKKSRVIGLDSLVPAHPRFLI